VGGTLEEVEEQCARLARRGQFLRAEGVEEWPDGTVAERYRFRHALCQQVVYDRLTSARCIRLHRQIGAWMEAAYQEHAREHAAEVEGCTLWLALLAEWYAYDGQIAAGLEAVTEALAVVHSHGLRAWEAELYRLRGQLLMRQAARQPETPTSAMDITAATCFR
jgi:hypothetical protein